MLSFAKKEYVEFLIIDDIGFVDFSEFQDFVNSHMSCVAYSCSDLVSLLPQLSHKQVVSVGNGGKEVLRRLNVVPVQTIDISRKWKQGKIMGFEHEQKTSFEKSPCLVDDVVGSGETAYYLKETFQLLNPDLFCLVYNSTPSKYKNNLGLVGFEHTVCSLFVEGEDKGNSYWYPAIYSLRHILQKPKSNSQYLANMAEKYFNNDVGGLELAVSKIK